MLGLQMVSEFPFHKGPWRASGLFVQMGLEVAPPGEAVIYTRGLVTW